MRLVAPVRILVVLCFWVMVVAARPTRGTRPCPKIVGIYPADLNFDAPLHQRARFEIRSCADGRGTIQLLGFRANIKAPSLLEEASNIELLIQTGTLIVLQTMAGSSDPTLVAQFQHGKPVLVGREDGVGGVTYAEDHTNGDYAIITIPQKTFPDAHGKFPKAPPHRYRLKIYE